MTDCCHLVLRFHPRPTISCEADDKLGLWVLRSYDVGSVVEATIDVGEGERGANGGDQLVLVENEGCLVGRET